MTFRSWLSVAVPGSRFVGPAAANHTLLMFDEPFRDAYRVSPSATLDSLADFLAGGPPETVELTAALFEDPCPLLDELRSAEAWAWVLIHFERWYDADADAARESMEAYLRAIDCIRGVRLH